MTDLDNPEIYTKLDCEGMLDRLKDMPAQFHHAWQMALDLNLPPDYSNINKIVVLGMGGSAIGGDLVASLVHDEAILPIEICRDYSLPAFVDDQTLVIASSYSGNTEETLSSFEQALKTGSKKVVISTGGKLKEMAEKHGVPVFLFDYKAQPRAALPYSFLPILAILQKLSVIEDKSADVAKMVELLKRLSRILNESIHTPQNPAKELAKKLYGKIGVIYGAEFLSEVARRWKTQLNENSKAWSFFEVLPELNHNAVVGYQFPSELAGKILVVFLRSKLLNPRTLLRYNITQLLLEQNKIEYQVVDAEGENPLSHLASLVLFGDYVSFYIALLYKTDPCPVQAIDFLKGELGKK